MINIKYEIYHNDYNRRYEDKSFGSMAEFKDWMFGVMNQPYADSTPNMYFLESQFDKGINSSSRIDLHTERGGAHYWIHCVSDNNNVVFSNGKYTNGQCYISEGFRAFMKECQDKRDGKVNDFVFGEVEGFKPAMAKSYTEQAVEFIKENPLVAREIHTLLDKQHHREDIVSKLEERGLRNLSDEDIDKLVDSFENALSKNDGYYESFWMSADFVIDEFVEKTGNVFKEFISKATLTDGKKEWDVTIYSHYNSYEEALTGITRFDSHGYNIVKAWVESSDMLQEVFALAGRELQEHGEFGYTMPDGKHHVYMYADFLDEDKVFVVEPNRVVDGAHEPFVGDTYIGSWDNFDELCKGIEWCLEQFDNDKEVSLEDKIANASERSETSVGVHSKDEPEVEIG